MCSASPPPSRGFGLSPDPSSSAVVLELGDAPLGRLGAREEVPHPAAGRLALGRTAIEELQCLGPLRPIERVPARVDLAQPVRGLSLPLSGLCLGLCPGFSGHEHCGCPFGGNLLHFGLLLSSPCFLVGRGRRL